MKSFEEKISILKRAQKENWAIGQFNFCNLEVLKAIFQAAKSLKSPVIIGTSEGESEYFGPSAAASLTRILEAETGVTAILHLDHGKSLDYIKKAVEAGYDSVHFDGSILPLQKNIEITKKIAEIGHEKGILVEGEVGILRGTSQILEKAPEIKEEDLTDPKEAEEFIKETGIDSLAVNIGSWHGMESSGRELRLDLARLKEIKKRVGNKVFLVLHGGSGVKADDIKEAVKIGIVKININTELRLAFKVSLEKIVKEGLKELAPYKYMTVGIDAVQLVVEEKIRLFGSEDKI